MNGIIIILQFVFDFIKTIFIKHKFVSIAFHVFFFFSMKFNKYEIIIIIIFLKFHSLFPYALTNTYNFNLNSI